VSVRDGAVRLIFAGWLPQDGLFGWSASAGLGNERGLRGVNPVAVHSRNADHSTRGGFLVFVVRLLGVLDERERCDRGRWCHPDHGSLFLVQAIPAGAWEVSTWPARSAASMNDVDADEHWQTIGRAGTTLAGLCLLLVTCVPINRASGGFSP
jgi:hypothetical protein